MTKESKYETRKKESTEHINQIIKNKQFVSKNLGDKKKEENEHFGIKIGIR